MTISLVSQQTYSQNLVGSTQPRVLTGITASVGDWLVLMVSTDTASFGGSVTDSAGNTWVTRAGVNRSGGPNCTIFTCEVTSALAAGTISATYAGGPRANIISLTRWSGVTAFREAGTTSGSSTSPTAATASTIGADCVAIGGIAHFASLGTLAAGWTGFGDLEHYPSGQYAYKVVTEASTVGPSWTLATSSSYAAATIVLMGTPPTPAFGDEPFLANPRPMQPPTHIDQARVVNFVDVLVDPAAAAATVTAQLPPALASLTAAAGPTETAGAVDTDLPAVTADLTATAPAYAALDAVLPAAVALVRGWADADGRITVVLPALTGALPADADAAGRITADLPAVTATWRADAPAGGVLDAALPAPAGSWAARAPAATAVVAVLPSVASALAAVVATRRNVTLTLGPPRVRGFTVTGPTGRDLNLGAPHGRALSVSAPHD